MANLFEKKTSTSLPPLTLSTVSLSFSERRRHREDPIPARKVAEFAPQAPKTRAGRTQYRFFLFSPIKPRKKKIEMGRFFCVEFDSPRVYCCASCGTSLAPAESLVSKVGKDRGSKDAREKESGREKKRDRGHFFAFPFSSDQARRRALSRDDMRTTEQRELFGFLSLFLNPDFLSFFLSFFQQIKQTNIASPSTPARVELICSTTSPTSPSAKTPRAS